ncbi:hypothetical protein [Thermoclostridium caenicola]|uniref:Uncharacterized protein n=1 Tax=Thermoclostridium caenicola TaxID=659425 RepID=A0A1M6F1Y7_9FIRM|nr:hypothetical protein [Thermoclostridium caenicola]SHI91681.1 hypothetical protein SAMN05444373_10151 [Thermoclostridium caenicola]
MDIEDCERHIYRTVMNLLWQVEAKYHESYVRADTRRIREVLERMHRHAEEASWELYTLSQEAHNAAVGYRNNESQLARLIAQSSIKFGLNFDMQKALSGIYRVTGVSTAIGSRLAVGNLNIKLGTGRVTALLAAGLIPALINEAGVADEQKIEKKQQEAMAKLDEILRVEQKIIAGEIYPTYHIAKLLSEKNGTIDKLLEYEKDEELKALLMQVREGRINTWEEYKKSKGLNNRNETDQTSVYKNEQSIQNETFNVVVADRLREKLVDNAYKLVSYDLSKSGNERVIREPIYNYSKAGNGPLTKDMFNEDGTIRYVEGEMYLDCQSLQSSLYKSVFPDIDIREYYKYVPYPANGGCDHLKYMGKEVDYKTDGKFDESKLKLGDLIIYDYKGPNMPQSSPN